MEVIYGKVECRIDSPGTYYGVELHPIWLTVANTCTIKQNGDLIRLSFEQARELHRDLGAAIEELINDPLNMRRRPSNEQP